MEKFRNAAHVAASLKPEIPVFCHRPDATRRAANWFLTSFPGDTFYAVKANPSETVLRALYQSGMRKFEVASIAEVRMIRALFADAEIAFMHPIKAPEAIAEAYHLHGVRVFALDHRDELLKILAQTGQADDLVLFLRHSVPNTQAKIKLGRKFGTAGDEAVSLLREMRQLTHTLGLCFHVGSQAMSPEAYIIAMDAIEQTILDAGVRIDVLDIGGGFPADYPGITPPPLLDFVTAIARRFESLPVAPDCQLWCEPGRALCAEAASLLIRVEARRGDCLHINDGVYGALFDAGHLNWPFPTRSLEKETVPVTAFELYGPTCDDLDHMPGPFMLAEDMTAGDYVEIGLLGAYGNAMRTGFNGFDAHLNVQVEDRPMTSMYTPSHAQSAPEEVKING